MASEGGEKKMVTVKCADGQLFQVPLAACALSQTISYAIEVCPDEGPNVVPLVHVNGITFTKILRYLVEHQDCDGAEKDKEALKKWDAEFIEVDTDTLYHILLASNYLDIKGLVDLCVTRAANLIRGRQPEEIRKIFNIKNDFSPEEEAAIRKDNEWAFDNK